MLRSQFHSGPPERLAVLALLVIGLVAYVNCLSSQFVFDDLLFINHQDLDARSLKWLAPEIDLPIKGRPLAGLTFVANYALHGARPEGYHLFNMVVHLACAAALFGTVRQAMLRHSAWNGHDHDPTRIAFACAVLWMIHPLQTECVNYVSQRTESLAALFVLLSLYCAIRSWQPQHRRRWIVATGAASWAGVLCKENAAVGPLLILLFEVTFSRLPARELARQRWRLYLAAFSSWFPLGGLLYLLPRSITVGANGDVTVLQYALNQALLLVHYVRLVFWPDVLVIDYGRPADVAWRDALPAAAFIVFLLVATLASYRRRPAVGYLGVACFLLLAPTSSVLPITSEVGAERRMYLPLAAVVVLVVLGTRQLVDRCCTWAERRWMRSPAAHTRATRDWTARAVLPCVLFAAAVSALGVRTIGRNGEYADSLKLWRQAVAARPDNARAWEWLVLELARVDPPAAQRASAEMAARWCDDRTVLFDVAEAYLCVHRDVREATRCYRRVVDIDPRHLKAQLRLVWMLAGCAEDELRSGTEALRIAQRLWAEYPDSAEVLDALAIAQAECGRFQVAITTAEAAIASLEAAGGSTATIRQRVQRYRQGKPFRFYES